MLDAIAPQSNFHSVKLPAALVRAAKASAQTFRRSTAAQIEYWALLGKSLENQGLTVEAAGVRVAESERALHARAELSRFDGLAADGALDSALGTVIAENAAKAAAPAS